MRVEPVTTDMIEHEGKLRVQAAAAPREGGSPRPAALDPLPWCLAFHFGAAVWVYGIVLPDLDDEVGGKRRKGRDVVDAIAGSLQVKGGWEQQADGRLGGLGG